MQTKAILLRNQPKSVSMLTKLVAWEMVSKAVWCGRYDGNDGHPLGSLSSTARRRWGVSQIALYFSENVSKSKCTLRWQGKKELKSLHTEARNAFRHSPDKNNGKQKSRENLPNSSLIHFPAISVPLCLSNALWGPSSGITQKSGLWNMVSLGLSFINKKKPQKNPKKKAPKHHFDHLLLFFETLSYLLQTFHLKWEEYF